MCRSSDRLSDRSSDRTDGRTDGLTEKVVTYQPNVASGDAHTRKAQLMDGLDEAIAAALTQQRARIVANLRLAAETCAERDADPHFIAGLIHAAELVRR